jgi:hypothetical protein
MLLDNPFGRSAFTAGENSQVEVAAGDDFPPRYAMLTCQRPAEQKLDAAGVYRA